MIAADRQPRAFYLLFFTQLWERFSFYLLQAIIILFMSKAMLLNDIEANLLYAAFNAFLYLTPPLGGYLADKYLGFQRAVIIGAVLFIIGYLFCASSVKPLFYLGLSILVCANGFFKGNITSLVGELYEKHDARRDSGFTLFYLGINLGALFPPLIAGFLVVTYGWEAVFLFAAASMILSLAIFLIGKKRLGQLGLPPSGSGNINYGLNSFILSGIILAILLCHLAFQYPKITNLIVEIASILLFSAVFVFLCREEKEARKKMLAALILIFISIAFWSLYNQAYTSLMLFADRNMQKQFFGLPFYAETTQFFNPFFIVVLSPLLSQLWIKLSHKNLNPSIQLKFCLGMVFISLSFLFLGLVSRFSATSAISPWYLAGSYFLQTIGELLISPIGLAMITVFSPRTLVGMMMGVWFFAQAASYAFAGFLANLAAVPPGLPPVHSLPIYADAFILYGNIALLMTAISFLLLPLLNRLTAER